MEEKIPTSFPRVGSGPRQRWPHRSLQGRLRPCVVPVSAPVGRKVVLRALAAPSPQPSLGDEPAAVFPAPKEGASFRNVSVFLRCHPPPRALWVEASPNHMRILPGPPVLVTRSC